MRLNRLPSSINRKISPTILKNHLNTLGLTSNETSKVIPDPRGKNPDMSQYSDEQNFKNLSGKLTKLHKAIKSEIDSERKNYATIKIEYREKNLQFASRRYSDERALDEAEIVSSFLCNDSEDIPSPDYDVKKLMYHLPLFGYMTSVDTRLPLDMTDRISVNNFLDELTSFNYRSSKENEESADNAISFMIKNHGHLINLDTYLNIIKFLSLKYEFLKMRSVLEIMENENKLKPDIRFYNILLRAAMNTKSKHRVRRCLRLLKEMDHQKIKPDHLTWNIVAAGFNKADSAFVVLSELLRLGIPLYGKKLFERKFNITFPILDALVNESGKMLPIQVANPLIDYSFNELLYHKRDLPRTYNYYNDVLSLISKDSNEYSVQPDFLKFKEMLHFLLFQANNLPFGIALFNTWKRKHSKLFDDPTRIREVYAMLTSSLVHFTDSQHWESLARYFYKLSLDTNNYSGVAESTIRELNNVALEKGIIGFSIHNALTMYNQKETSETVNNLRWIDQPLWDYESNSLKFKRSCVWVGNYENEAHSHPTRTSDVSKDIHRSPETIHAFDDLELADSDSSFEIDAWGDLPLDTWKTKLFTLSSTPANNENR